MSMGKKKGKKKMVVINESEQMTPDVDVKALRKEYKK